MPIDDNTDAVLATVLAAAAQVFGRQVHHEDNLFDLGGDSITAVELVMRLAEDLGVVVDTADLVEAPDFETFARHLSVYGQHTF
ncbi:acyl carrier protein [Micromonospora sp. NPDC049240]|uniref:acyl carrier protein n=1 Tax=Micromonospora sp. NPDC049240 TaxID=3155151 RepID=UPI00340E6A2A